MADRQPLDAPFAVLTRAVLGLLAVLAYLATRPLLDEAALAAARFGLGILLFALLLDLGRSVAGTGHPLRGHLSAHVQRADAQVDEDYQRLRSALEAYIEEGEVAEDLLDHVHQAAQARGLAGKRARRLDGTLREAARPRGPTNALLAVRMLSGLVVALGLGLTAATMAESLGMAVVPPVLLVTGTSIATLQWRAQDAGARWTGLAVGLAGLGLFALGALRFLTASIAAGGLLLAITTMGLAGTAWATWRTSRGQDPWDVVEQRLESTTTKLRRAFLVAMVAGVVVFALEPLLTSLMGLLGLPTALGFEVPALLIATVVAFLAIEGAGTWLTLTRGRRRAESDRRARQQAIATVLARLEDARTRTPAPEDAA